jgi:hypothetical protein
MLSHHRRHHRRFLAVLLSLALATAAAVIALIHRDPVAGSAPPSTAAVASAASSSPSFGHAPGREPALPPVPDRAGHWLSDHPPSSALHDALIAVAERADQLAAAAPPRTDDIRSDGVVAARAARNAEQQELRAQLRRALEAMSPTERAAMRAAHLNVIQLARAVAGRQDS